MSARFLDAEARSAFKQAIETVEGLSAVEVVVSVRRTSAGYRHANLIVGLVATFAALATMLFSAQPFGLVAILFDPFLVGAIAGALVELLPQVKRWLTPPAVRSRHVHHAARAAFVDRGVHNTLDRSGLLVYIAWLEQQVALVADSGLAGALPAEAIRRAEAALTAQMSRGGVAVATALEQLGTQLGTVMPRREGDVNELPDAIDSDLARPAGPRGARSRPS